MLRNENQPCIHSIGQCFQSTESSVDLSAERVANMRDAHCCQISQTLERLSQFSTALLELLKNGHAILSLKYIDKLFQSIKLGPQFIENHKYG